MRLYHCKRQMYCCDSRPSPKGENYLRKRRWACRECTHRVNTYEITEEALHTLDCIDAAYGNALIIRKIRELVEQS